jgi:hypothetical protein
MPLKPKIPENVLKYFQQTGAQGGKKRAEKYSAEQLQAWGRMGGRPKGSGKIQKEKGSK